MNFVACNVDTHLVICVLLHNCILLLTNMLLSLEKPFNLLNNFGEIERLKLVLKIVLRIVLFFLFTIKHSLILKLIELLCFWRVVFIHSCKKV